MEGVAFGQGLDVGLLLRRHLGRELERPVNGFVGRLHGTGIHRQVDIGAQRVGDAPVAHGAGGVEPGTFGEGVHRLLVVEPVGEPESLVEVFLGDGRPAGDRHVQGAQVVVEWRLGVGRGRLHGGFVVFVSRLTCLCRGCPRE